MQHSTWRTQACACACDRVLMRDRAGHCPNLQDLGGGFAETEPKPRRAPGDSELLVRLSPGWADRLASTRDPLPRSSLAGGTFDPPACRPAPRPVSAPRSVPWARPLATLPACAPHPPAHCGVTRGQREPLPCPPARSLARSWLPMTRRDSTPTAATRDVTSQTLASPSVRWKQSSPPGTRGQWRDGRRGRRRGVTPATSASGAHVGCKGKRAAQGL